MNVQFSCTSFPFLLFLSLFQCSTCFVFGTASASWQYEGALHKDGRGPSIWDQFCSTKTPSHRSNCLDGMQDASIADNQYNLTIFAQDIVLMQELGTTAYRLSLSWSRIMPTGRLNSLNTQGIEHYRTVLTMLNQAGIEPWVTLFHFDLPLTLETEEKGWLNRSMANRFADYAEICFNEYDALVNRWITINEAHTIATAGYLYDGVAAPGRCTNRSNCFEGNGTIEPYVVGHNLLRAHAFAVDIFRKIQSRKKTIANMSTISMVISGDWTEPWNNRSIGDIEASNRRQEFQIGWFGDPIFYGDYPKSMRTGIGGNRLPKFTKQEQKMLMHSADFFALNHYTSRYGQQPVSCLNTSGGANVTNGKGWDEDQCCETKTFDMQGNAIGPRPNGSEWLYSVPWGIRKLLKWVGNRYPGVEIIVTENGVVDPVRSNQSSNGIDSVLNDTFRIEYHRDYLRNVRMAIEIDKVNVQGYFIWSLLDNVEWGDGFRDTFGLYSVERPSMIRIAKRSVNFIQQYIKEW